MTLDRVIIPTQWKYNGDHVSVNDENPISVEVTALCARNEGNGRYISYLGSIPAIPIVHIPGDQPPWRLKYITVHDWGYSGI